MRLRISARFIPAGAGNTPGVARRAADHSVYPRWRGEHFSARRNIPAHAGLSPLARGTPGAGVPDDPPKRFIPAGAGNTSNASGSLSAPPVYPRRRGEHPLVRQVWRRKTGLSPLARGTLSAISETVSSTRFIPAGAGNTLSVEHSPGDSSVYPRWRGEHCAMSPGGWCRCGLSPLARGTPIRILRMLA